MVFTKPARVQPRSTVVRLLTISYASHFRAIGITDLEERSVKRQMACSTQRCPMTTENGRPQLGWSQEVEGELMSASREIQEEQDATVVHQ